MEDGPANEGSNGPGPEVIDLGELFTKKNTLQQAVDFLLTEKHQENVCLGL